MNPDDKTQRLAAEIAKRHDDTEARLVLFLGTGCARAAGVPSGVEMARMLFANIEGESPETVNKYVPGDKTSDEQIIRGFHKILGDLPSAQRAAFMLHFVGNIPVPLFYQDLAVLVQAGYFRRVLTTNLDTLFEDALEDAGLRKNRHYRVVSWGGAAAPAPDLSDNEDAITIVKFHGDISSREFAITPDEIVRAFDRRLRLLKRELRHDMVIVGYEFESPPLTEQLARVRGNTWWVSPERPPRDVRTQIEQVREVAYISGSSGAPESFFGQLSLLLLQMPALNAITKPLESIVKDQPVPLETMTDTSPPDDAERFTREYLIGQLRRSEAVLGRLRLQGAAVDADERLARQIEYQRRQIAKLEDRLRGLSHVRGRILTLLDEIDRDAASKDRSEAADYLHRQVEIVRAEYAGDNPNEPIISATLGATMILADRLNVRRALVRELAHFGARADVRGIW